MIRINISENKMKEIEEIHWEWFKENGDKKLKQYLQDKKYKKNKKEESDIPEYVYDFLKFLDKNKKCIIIGNLRQGTEEIKSIDSLIEEIKDKYHAVYNYNLIENFMKKTKSKLKFKEIKNKKESIKNQKLLKSTKDKMKELFKDKNINCKKVLKMIDEIEIKKGEVKGFDKLEEKNKALKVILEDIFNYKSFTDGGKANYKGKEIKWGAYELLKKLGVTVCPYCNRQYINTYIDKNSKMRADIDHFYPKSKYPFLAVSLYNLIPSCHSCNSSLKGSYDFYKNKCIYPYKEDFGQDAKFTTKFLGEKDKAKNDKSESVQEEDLYDINYLLGNSDNFDIDIEPIDLNSDKGKKIHNSISIFRLDKIYNFHKDYVKELIKKAIIYNESRIDELYEQYPELFSSREEVVQMVVSNYIDKDDLGKRPLAKLTMDICEQLGLK